MHYPDGPEQRTGYYDDLVARDDDELALAEQLADESRDDLEIADDSR